MLPSAQNFASSSVPLSGPYPSNPIQPNFNPVAPFPNQQTFLPQTLQDHSLHQGADPNSPEIFKQNILLIRDKVGQLQNLAQSALTGIQNAYHPGNSPAQTEASIVAVKQILQEISNVMRSSGVGALPLLPLSRSEAPPIMLTESQMITETNQSIQTLYEKLKRGQESAAVVANLLGTQDQISRPK